MHALPAETKDALLAGAAAQLLVAQLADEASARPETEAAIARLGIDWSEALDPRRSSALSKPHFWDRLPHATLTRIGVDAYGEDFRTDAASMRKGALATHLAARLGPGANQADRRTEWLPDGLRAPVPVPEPEPESEPGPKPKPESESGSGSDGRCASGPACGPGPRAPAPRPGPGPGHAAPAGRRGRRHPQPTGHGLAPVVPDPVGTRCTPCR